MLDSFIRFINSFFDLANQWELYTNTIKFILTEAVTKPFNNVLLYNHTLVGLAVCFTERGRGFNFWNFPKKACLDFSHKKWGVGKIGGGGGELF